MDIKSDLSKLALVAAVLAFQPLQADWKVPNISDRNHGWAKQIAVGKVVRDWGTHFDAKWKSQEKDFTQQSLSGFQGKRNQAFTNLNGQFYKSTVFMGDDANKPNTKSYVTLRASRLPADEEFLRYDAVDEQYYNVRWSSGYFRTKAYQAIPKRFYEARIRTPKHGKSALENLSHSFWTRRQKINGKGPFEIDVLESVPNGFDGLMPMNLHQMAEKEAGQTRGKVQSLSHSAKVGNRDGEWHTYGLLWEVDKLQWFFDGRLVRRMWRVPGGKLKYQFSDGLIVVGKNAKVIKKLTRVKHSLIFSQAALLGALPNHFKNSKGNSSQDMQIDYIARYKIK